MPITPFHLGPGLLFKAIAPERVSFAAFVAVNVLIDAEVVVRAILSAPGLHAHLHTIAGATLAALAAGVGTWAISRRWPWTPIGLSPALVGALLGALFQVGLDGVMHLDVAPLAPWSEANPLLNAVPYYWLRRFCIVAAVIGVWGLYFRLRRAD